MVKSAASEMDYKKVGGIAEKGKDQRRGVLTVLGDMFLVCFDL